METIACAVPSTETSTTGWPLAGRLIDALSRRNFADLQACLADDVRLRAVLPRAVLELDSAEAVAAKFAQWFGGSDCFEVLDASAGAIGPRQHVRWRIRMWPQDAPEQSRVVEQQIYTRGTDRAECLDLLCSGFHDEHPAGAR